MNKNSEKNSAQNIDKVLNSALTELSATKTLDSLDEWRIRYLGRKGIVVQLKRSISDLPSTERPEFGQTINSASTLLEEKLIDQHTKILSRNSTNHTESIDVTLPGVPINNGSLHPITQTIRDICEAFTSMGFEIIEGPEVELDYYNFQMLNIPKHHPARDGFNTLWIDHEDANGERPMLLRTHTSPMQIRTMEKQDPPIRLVVPGKVYRYEATDSSHEWHFSQIEGLAVDKGITFANLKGTLYEFARRLFGEDVKVRFRCDYFPFVEPGAEMAIDWNSRTKDTEEENWVEILGAGMVHPKVLKAVGYDTEKYTGFAFGIGVERIAMLRNGIDDIRLFYNNDVRFLGQF
ncbi:MAG: phenylalanine--tRNA ligase subunit alpha [Dehalococcoidia bacterium]|nr:phenylalanine--tRNA ligase subunit alpha [Dehalococcoidia bacterium]|tara:strand:+ start:370 stop:1416 length:1047 start_codon:yes stop_codon:yes gene_type:complete